MTSGVLWCKQVIYYRQALCFCVSFYEALTGCIETKDLVVVVNIPTLKQVFRLFRVQNTFFKLAVQLRISGASKNQNYPHRFWRREQTPKELLLSYSVVHLPRPDL